MWSIRLSQALYHTSTDVVIYTFIRLILLITDTYPYTIHFDWTTPLLITRLYWVIHHLSPITFGKVPSLASTIHFLSEDSTLSHSQFSQMHGALLYDPFLRNTSQ